MTPEQPWAPPEGEVPPAGSGPAPVPGAGEPQRRPGRDAKLVATGISIALLVWFAIANFQGVTIRFWVVSTSAPLVVVIVISGALGAAVALLAGWSVRRRRRDAPH